MALALTTEARVLTILGEGLGAKEQALIAMLISSVSARIESALGRGTLTQARTEYIDVAYGQRILQLTSYPITTVSSVYNDSAREYGSSSLVDDDDYAVVDTLGQVIVDYDLIPGARSAKVTYTGGLATTTDNLISSYPDIAMAAEYQIVHEFRRRRDSLDGSSVSLPSGGVAFVGELKTLKIVEQMIDRYRRWAA